LLLRHNILLVLGVLALGGCHFDSDRETTGSDTASAAPSAEPGAAVVNWDVPTQNANGTPLKDLAGYTILYGSSPDAMDQTVEINDISTTSYAINGLGKGTWYFAVVSVTTSGESSTLSDVVSKTIS
jgi:hypothetical protein